jgi:hypothetical protein
MKMIPKRVPQFTKFYNNKFQGTVLDVTSFTTTSKANMAAMLLFLEVKILKYGAGAISNGVIILSHFLETGKMIPELHTGKQQKTILSKIGVNLMT